MRGIQFDEIHTADDWGLILSSKKNNPPNPKYVKVSIDGRDGELNLSRALTGDIAYDNRKAIYKFTATEGTQADREELISNIINSIHGRELKIIEPDDPDHYLLGECSVSDVKNDRAYATFTVTADCEPYRYAINEINRVINLTTTPVNVILTNNGVKTVIPTLTVEGSAKIVVGSTSTTLSSGTYKLTALVLKKGSTTITVSGSNKLTVSYREGIL